METHSSPADRKARKVLGSVIDILTSAHPRRQELASWLLATAPPPVRGELVKRLLGRLKAGSEESRRHAASSLVDFGAAAATATYLAFCRSRIADLQLRLAEVLAGIARALSGWERVKLLLDIRVCLTRARSDEVAAALKRVHEEQWPAALREGHAAPPPGTPPPTRTPAGSPG
jgi:hypothetical protein